MTLRMIIGIFTRSSSLLYSFELYSQWTNARKKLVRIRVMEENHSRVSFRAILSVMDCSI